MAAEGEPLSAKRGAAVGLRDADYYRRIELDRDCVGWGECVVYSDAIRRAWVDDGRRILQL